MGLVSEKAIAAAEDSVWLMTRIFASVAAGEASSAFQHASAAAAAVGRSPLK